MILALILLACPAHAYQASPDDWRDQFIYFLMTDRFSDGDASNNSANGPYAPADGAGIHGGDLQGVINRLDYIQGLGATTVWITPVCKNRNAYHGYAAWDLVSVDPKLGAMQDLKNLSAALHSRGMYLILDIVPNHTADLIGTTTGVYTYQFPATYTLQYHNAAVHHEPDTFNNLAFYHAHGGIGNYIDPEQILGEFPGGLDDLKTEDTPVRAALLEVFKFWIRESDCDGFRVDTIKHVEMGYWQEFCPAIRSYAATLGKDRFFLFGEAFTNDDSVAGSYTGAQAGGAFAFDAVLHFSMQDAIRRVFKENAATSDLDARYTALTNFDTTSRDRLVAFLDNHDMARFLPAGNASAYHSRLKSALVFLLSQQGVPCVYYGTEQGFDGGGDPWNREDMWDGQWDFGPSDGDNFNTSHALYEYLKNVARIRRNWSPLRRGNQIQRWNSPTGAGIYAFSRIDTSGEVLVVMNTDSVSRAALTGLTGITTTYAAGTRVHNMLSLYDSAVVGENVAAANQVRITVPGFAASIFVPNDTPAILPDAPAVEIIEDGTGVVVGVRSLERIHPDSVTWRATSGVLLNVTVGSGTAPVLTIIPVHDAVGVDSVCVVSTDPWGASDTVWIRVTILAGPPPAANLSGVVVYPNPYLPYDNLSGNGKPYRAGDAASGIFFDALPIEVTVRIVNLAGLTVATFSKRSNDARYQWDPRSADGRELSSGVYFAVLRTPSGDHAERKLIIIR